MLACGYVLINVWLCPGVLYMVPTDAGIFVFLLVPRSLFCSVLCYIIIIILFFCFVFLFSVEAVIFIPLVFHFFVLSLTSILVVSAIFFKESAV